MKITMTLTKDREDATVVHYGTEEAKRNPLLAAGITLGRASLPDPAPTILRLSLEWEPAPSPEGWTGVAGAEAPGAPWIGEVRAGDHLVVVKSRISGANYPPEWLQQYLGRTGVVLWITTDGAMLDFEGKASWFSFKELKPGP